MSMMTRRTVADIERDITAARKERLLYVSPHGVKGIHDRINDLLDERDLALKADADVSPAP